VLDEDSGEASLEQLILSDASVLERKIYEGRAAVWPELTVDPALRRFADAAIVASGRVISGYSGPRMR
jgi:hypothetical protein